MMASPTAMTVSRAIRTGGERRCLCPTNATGLFRRAPDGTPAQPVAAIAMSGVCLEATTGSGQLLPFASDRSTAVNYGTNGQLASGHSFQTFRAQNGHCRSPRFPRPPAKCRPQTVDAISKRLRIFDFESFDGCLLRASGGGAYIYAYRLCLATFFFHFSSNQVPKAGIPR